MVKSNKLIKGLHYAKEVYDNLKEGEITHLVVHLTNKCNYKCKYCGTWGRKTQREELTYDERVNLIEQAHELGAKAVFLSGEGEPMMDNDFKELVKLNHSLGMTTILYTNMSHIDSDMATFLYKHDVSIVLKLDSLDKEIYNKITDSNEFEKAMHGLKCIEEAYGDQQEETKLNGAPRLEVSTVLTNINKDKVSKIREYCDEKSIVLCCKTPGRKGLAAKNWDELVGENKEELEKIARENTDKYQTTGNIEGKCVATKYSAVISRTGIMYMCSSLRNRPIGDIRKHSLKELLKMKKEQCKDIGDVACLAKHFQK